MNPIDRVLERQREEEWRHQIPILRIAALSLLGIVMAGMLTLLYLHSPGLLSVVLTVICFIGKPLFVVGRDHARWVRGNKNRAQSYNL